MNAAFSPLPPLTLQQAEDALHRIPANIPRNEWAAIAAALRGEFGGVAFDAFDSWSATGDTYNRADARDTWKSAGKRSCSIGTLLHHAKGYGWTAPRRHPLTPSEQARSERETIPSFRQNIKENGFVFGFGDKIAPRLGVSYDVRGDGRLKAFASWGRYYDWVKYELARGSFGGDNWTINYRALDTLDVSSLLKS